MACLRWGSAKTTSARGVSATLRSTTSMAALAFAMVSTVATVVLLVMVVVPLRLTVTPMAMHRVLHLAVVSIATVRVRLLLLSLVVLRVLVTPARVIEVELHWLEIEINLCRREGDFSFLKSEMKQQNNYLFDS